VREGAGNSVLEPGDKFTQEPDALASFSNQSDALARLFVAVVSPSGAAESVDQPDSPAPALLPTVTLTGSTTVPAIPGPFRVSQGIFDFVPGAGSGAHSHSGPGIVIVMSGQMTKRTPDGDVKQAVGDVFTEIGGHAVDHRNLGPDVATVATSYLVGVGAPPAVPATLPGSPPLITVPAAPTPTPAPLPIDCTSPSD
jgi:quercetin dioxygenase-like cupin family protein